MASEAVRQRSSKSASTTAPVEKQSNSSRDSHPAGEAKHGLASQIFRALVSMSVFLGACVAIHVAQWFFSPLYFINKDYYYAAMALTKQYFGVLIIELTQWFAPTKLRVSWHPDLRGEIHQAADGMLETKFPERIILMSNHQIYTEWLYVWWSAYTSKMHGHIFIILKESLKYVPFLGPGMMFYGFIFMARKWEKDKPRLLHRLQQLKTRHGGPMSGSQTLDPMWLIIFPEGTNLSANTRKKSVAWSERSGKPDMKHVLLPRSTGMYFCVQELKDSVDWIYDCTLGYEGVAANEYAQDYFTLRSTYLQGRPPKSVSLYWRKFAVADIPLGDQKAFEKWIEDRWREKDELLDGFYKTGQFPADTEAADQKHGESGCITTEVRLRTHLEFLSIYTPLATVGLVLNILLKFLERFGLA